MKSLVLELQAEALDSSIPVSDLLRKAKTVAVKLGIKDFLNWIENELNGYGDEKIPDYRIVEGETKFNNPYHGWQSIEIPDHEISEQLCSRGNPYPISEIENIARTKNPEKPLFFHYAPSAENSLKRLYHTNYKPSLLFGVSQLSKILDKVRNIILDWSLKLEQEGILGEGMTFKKEEKDKAQSETLNIQNYIGNVSNSQIMQDSPHSNQTMKINDLDLEKVSEFITDLISKIAELKLDSETAAELKAETDTVQAQLSSPKPKKKIIRESLGFIKKVIEGATGTVAGKLLIDLGNFFI